jgi:hypothetical protein
MHQMPLSAAQLKRKLRQLKQLELTVRFGRRTAPEHPMLSIILVSSPAPHEALQLDLEGRNRWIWEHHRGRSLQDILEEAEQVFGELLAAVQMFTDEELTDVDLFRWTHGEPLGEGYISGNAYEHYHEHLPAIRA